MHPSGLYHLPVVSSIHSISDCIRWVLRTMAELLFVSQRRKHDDDSSLLIHNVKAERWFLRHTYRSDTLNSHSFSTSSSTRSTGSRWSSVSYMDSHTLLLSTTSITSTTTTKLGAPPHLHRSLLLIQPLRGLNNNDNSMENTNESIYLSNEGTQNAGTIISILLCILIVVLFTWLGYCACWFSYGGYVTTVLINLFIFTFLLDQMIIYLYT